MGETWIEVPKEPVFALRRIQPNPSSGSLAVSFALPGSGPATLELIDVSGRIVALRSVGQLGPGSHVVTLAGERGALRPGVYAVRLRRADRSVSTRAVVVR
jgi:hypothetical protein